MESIRCGLTIVVVGLRWSCGGGFVVMWRNFETEGRYQREADWTQAERKRMYLDVVVMVVLVGSGFLTVRHAGKSNHALFAPEMDALVKKGEQKQKGCGAVPPRLPSDLRVGILAHPSTSIDMKRLGGIGMALVQIQKEFI